MSAAIFERYLESLDANRSFFSAQDIARFEAYRDELLAFVELAQGQADNPCSAHDGVEALRLAQALTLSAREHRPVRLSEVTA